MTEECSKPSADTTTTFGEGRPYRVTMVHDEAPSGMTCAQFNTVGEQLAAEWTEYRVTVHHGERAAAMSRIRATHPEIADAFEAGDPTRAMAMYLHSLGGEAVSHPR